MPTSAAVARLVMRLGGLAIRPAKVTAFCSGTFTRVMRAFFVFLRHNDPFVWLVFRFRKNAYLVKGARLLHRAWLGSPSLCAAEHRNMEGGPKQARHLCGGEQTLL